MRKINKDFNKVPASLNVKDKKIAQIRREIIKNKEYTEKYDNFYKKPDVKEQLEMLYHRKCAYCESYVEQGQVEHFRPKDQYYWLAFSWDNLLIACPTCNRNKSTSFPISNSNKRVTEFDVNDINEINQISQKYDSIENPLLLNPEKDELKNIFSFDLDGKISSDNIKGKKTIEICKLNRPALIDERRRIIDKFKEDINACLFENNKDSQKIVIKTLVVSFKNEANNDTSAFIALRKYTLFFLLKKIIRSCVKGNIK